MRRRIGKEESFREDIIKQGYHNETQYIRRRKKISKNKNIKKKRIEPEQQANFKNYNNK
jgi:hypothetical protein